MGVGRGREILLMMDRMGKRMTMELGAPLGTSYDCLHFKGMEVEIIRLRTIIITTRKCRKIHVRIVWILANASRFGQKNGYKNRIPSSFYILFYIP